MSRWESATRFPSVIERTAAPAMPVKTLGETPPGETEASTRNNTSRAAPFGATERNATAGVGIPA